MWGSGTESPLLRVYSVQLNFPEDNFSLSLWLPVFLSFLSFLPSHILNERSKLITETDDLHQQNAELRMLLHQYLNSPVSNGWRPRGEIELHEMGLTHFFHVGRSYVLGGNSRNTGRVESEDQKVSVLIARENVGKQDNCVRVNACLTMHPKLGWLGLHMVKHSCATALAFSIKLS